MTVESAYPAGARDRAPQHFRVRFLQPERVSAADGGEPLGERQCVEEAHRQPFELVGADRQPAATRGERVQRGLEPGKWPRLIRDVRGVVVDEVAHHPVDLDHVERAALRFQPAHDQRPRAATDHVAGCIIGNGRQAGASENDVEGGDEIGRAVDQRAVEIQNDGRSHHPRIAIC